MTIKNEMRRASAALSRTLSKMDRVEESFKLKPAFCSRGEITVEVRGKEVFIEAPRNTIIHCSCWANDITKMDETFTMGSEEHEYLIKEIMDLEGRINALEKQL